MIRTNLLARSWETCRLLLSPLLVTALLLGVVLPGRVLAQKVEPPAGKPPEFVVVDEILKDGKLKLSFFQTVAVNRLEKFEVVRAGKKTPEARTVPFQASGLIRITHVLPEGTAAVDGTGKKLSKAEVLARLKPGQMVLLSRDNQPCAPAFLGALKPDAIVLISRQK